MGGATDLGPVTDADDLVIGTGNKRTAGESFSGWIDELKIHRGALGKVELESRYSYVAPPPPVTRDMVPAGKVLIQISEKGVPEANTWPEEPEVTETYAEEAFGFFDWPQKYISTGVRADRAMPSHFRATAVVTLPKGKNRLLLRGRGASRIYIDGKKVLENAFPSGDTGGHGHVCDTGQIPRSGSGFPLCPSGKPRGLVRVRIGRRGTFCHPRNDGGRSRWKEQTPSRVWGNGRCDFARRKRVLVAPVTGRAASRLHR